MMFLDKSTESTETSAKVDESESTDTSNDSTTETEKESKEVTAEESETANLTQTETETVENKAPLPAEKENMCEPSQETKQDANCTPAEPVASNKVDEKVPLTDKPIDAPVPEKSE